MLLCSCLLQASLTGQVPAGAPELEGLNRGEQNQKRGGAWVLEDTAEPPSWPCPTNLQPPSCPQQLNSIPKSYSEQAPSELKSSLSNSNSWRSLLSLHRLATAMLDARGKGEGIKNGIKGRQTSYGFPYLQERHRVHLQKFKLLRGKMSQLYKITNLKNNYEKHLPSQYTY